MRTTRSLALGVAVLGFGLATASFLPADAFGAEGTEAATVPESAPGSEVGASTPGRSATSSSWAYDLAGDLMSPFCPGRTVASCPSPQATELIQWIATQEAAGATREEVIGMLVAKYGEEILGAPPAKGITLWAYVFPVLGFVAFGGIAGLVLRRIVSPAATRPGPSPSATGAASGAGPSSNSSSSSSSAAPAPTAGREERADEFARIVDAELAERA